MPITDQLVNPEKLVIGNMHQMKYEGVSKSWLLRESYY